MIARLWNGSALPSGLLRGLAIGCAVGVAVLCGTAAADSEETEYVPPAPLVRGVSLVRPEAPWKWQTVRVPKIPRRIGAMAVSGADVLAGRATAPVDVLGDPVPPPKGWPFRLDHEASAIGTAASDERIAAAFGITTFKLGPVDQGYEMLELRLHYQDGVVVWLNGIEVARQAMPRVQTTTTLARVPHGPEWETFYIPVAPGLLVMGENTLAVEVHPSARRTAPRLSADLVARRDRGIVRGPILVDATQTTATIAVETDPNVEAVLEWGIGDASDRRQVSSPGRIHRFELANLPANTRIGYRVHAGANRSPRYTFHTMPGNGAVIRLGVYGDVRGGHATHRRLIDRMLAEGLDAVAVTGDMVLHGSDDADWQRFFAITQEMLASVPYYPAVGNHDVGWDGAHGPDGRNGDGKPVGVFALPKGPPDRPAGGFWYSRDLADVHLVFLDSNSYERPEQEAWLEADLAAARKRGARAILVFTHDGPYSRGYHGGSPVARDRYVPILLRHRVDLVLSGHDHIYQRGEKAGLRYVVTGGGGASLYAIRCDAPGRPRCKEPEKSDGTQMIAREHHYVVLVIGRDVEMCVRRPDGTLLEKCTRYKLGAK